MWSRRRAAVEAEAQAEVQAEADAVVADERAVLEEMSDEEALAELNLPDPDEMEAGSDFSAFMKGVVPDRLRRRALRKLWLTNPVLANVDNLVDYGEDFSISTTLVENIQTIYRVGKGMLPDKPDQSELENEGLNSEEIQDLTDSAENGQLETQENSGAVEERTSETEGVDSFGADDIFESGAVKAERVAVVEPVEVEVAEVAIDQFIKRRMRFEFVT